ncbi:DUF2523 domain-containing protein [Paracidovorax valerianellae]|uniref:DUF2523 domain-containing protein n=1 Tax=Paracidovorax valerianellae TaxID=187868 RepID=UPI002304230E|nr:DUF2523 domain-containing protein [Paracidovorax valerianellae]MDA8445301.1 DUF2523 domain-containing protein [Paracidovorax valerianellae]
MPAFIAAIGGMLLNLMGSFAGQVLISLGIAAVTYTGVDTVLTTLKGNVLQAMTGLPADMVALLSYMQVGVAISIVTSAVAVRMGINGMTGAVTRFRKK